ncbi:hypothetical protein OSH11_04260 [Kaistia dalseonensis]|uniref:Uncharacterized protein n=1 Tax=Kaistia dalseonensis TaxID=410840 RepID=A0ABU0H2F8_9HYPH|nr:hypothetical protein [Kaistia dalseonensis]MCX5493906.1 hypothetical protein [Kaistia dalseonensis]MDQ0436472.1 hypothetical protein [Kaistia dalseonensis]
MGGLVRLIVLLIIIVGGYWAYYAFAAANPNDSMGVAINKRLPVAARQFACQKLKERFGDIQAPEGCADFAFWAPVATAPATTAPAATTP